MTSFLGAFTGGFFAYISTVVVSYLLLRHRDKKATARYKKLLHEFFKQDTASKEPATAYNPVRSARTDHN